MMYVNNNINDEIFLLEWGGGGFFTVKMHNLKGDIFRITLKCLLLANINYQSDVRRQVVDCLKQGSVSQKQCKLKYIVDPLKPMELWSTDFLPCFDHASKFMYQI